MWTAWSGSRSPRGLGPRAAPGAKQLPLTQPLRPTLLLMMVCGCATACHRPSWCATATTPPPTCARPGGPRHLRRCACSWRASAGAQFPWQRPGSCLTALRSSSRPLGTTGQFRSRFAITRSPPAPCCQTGHARSDRPSSLESKQIALARVAALKRLFEVEGAGHPGIG